MIQVKKNNFISSFTENKKQKKITNFFRFLSVARIVKYAKKQKII